MALTETLDIIWPSRSLKLLIFIIYEEERVRKVHIDACLVEVETS